VGTYSTHGLMPQPWGMPPVKLNQDFGTMLYPMGGKPEHIMFTVADGHGRNGSRASQVAAHAINECVENGMAHSDSGETIDVMMPRLLATAFEAAHGRLDEDPERDDFEASGTTAVVVAISEQEMWVAHVGDSRAMLGQSDGSVVELSIDHKVNDPVEKERILAAGGLVSELDGEAARVVTHNETGTKFALGMSRSIGDLRFVSVGVSHTAEVSQRTIVDTEDSILILATDGIWEFVGNEEAYQIVQDSWQQHSSATMAARALINRAKDLWFEIEGDYRDDITVTIVDIPRLRNHMKSNPPSPLSPGMSPAGSPKISPAWIENHASHAGDAKQAAAANEGAPGPNIYDSGGAQFMKRRASVMPIELGEGVSLADLALPAPVSENIKADPKSLPSRKVARRLSLSPELDMNLWKTPDDQNSS